MYIREMNEELSSSDSIPEPTNSDDSDFSLDSPQQVNSSRSQENLVLSPSDSILTNSNDKNFLSPAVSRGENSAPNDSKPCFRVSISGEEWNVKERKIAGRRETKALNKRTFKVPEIIPLLRNF